MKRIGIIAGAAGVIIIGGLAWAQMGPGQPGMGPGMMGSGQPQGQAQQSGPPAGQGMMGPGGMTGHGMMGPGGHPGPGMPPGMMGPGMMGGGSANDRPWITFMLNHREELGLSAEQIGRLFTLRDQYSKEARAKSEALGQKEQEIVELLGPGQVDLRAVEAKVKEAEAIRTDMRLTRLRVIEEGKQVLTPQQRTRLAEIAKRTPQTMGGPGMEEMQRFMQSERGTAAMTAMMDMARRMGNGDPMLGMMRMMDMMGQMGGMGTPGRPAPTE